MRYERQKKQYFISLDSMEYRQPNGLVKHSKEWLWLTRHDIIYSKENELLWILDCHVFDWHYRYKGFYSTEKMQFIERRNKRELWTMLNAETKIELKEMWYSKDNDLIEQHEPEPVKTYTEKIIPTARFNF